MKVNVRVGEKIYTLEIPSEPRLEFFYLVGLLDKVLKKEHAPKPDTYSFNGINIQEDLFSSSFGQLGITEGAMLRGYNDPGLSLVKAVRRFDAGQVNQILSSNNELKINTLKVGNQPLLLYLASKIHLDDDRAILKLLLSAGADPNIQDAQGDTALICVLKAKILASWDLDVVNLLIAAHADKNHRNHAGDRAIDIINTHRLAIKRSYFHPHDEQTAYRKSLYDQLAGLVTGTTTQPAATHCVIS